MLFIIKGDNLLALSQNRQTHIYTYLLKGNRMIDFKEFTQETKGHFFKVVFIKRDGSIREMICRTGVHKYVKGTGAPSDKVVTVWDTSKKAYRAIKPETVLYAQCGKLQYLQSQVTLNKL